MYLYFLGKHKNGPNWQYTPVGINTVLSSTLNYIKGYLITSGSSVRLFSSVRQPSIILSKKLSFASRSATSV